MIATAVAPKTTITKNGRQQQTATMPTTMDIVMQQQDRWLQQLLLFPLETGPVTRGGPIRPVGRAIFPEGRWSASDGVTPPDASFVPVQVARAKGISLTTATATGSSQSLLVFGAADARASSSLGAKEKVDAWLSSRMVVVAMRRWWCCVFVVRCSLFVLLFYWVFFCFCTAGGVERGFCFFTGFPVHLNSSCSVQRENVVDKTRRTLMDIARKNV